MHARAARPAAIREPRPPRGTPRPPPRAPAPHTPRAPPRPASTARPGAPRPPRTRQRRGIAGSSSHGGEPGAGARGAGDTTRKRSQIGPSRRAAASPRPVAQYSFSLTTFSPSGKLVQIEYALNAVAAGATSLGISATDGVVIATEKKLPSILVDESTVQKITTLSPNIGMVYSGMGPDYRVLVRKARKTAQQYFRLYQEHIPVAQLVREVAAVMQEFTRERAAGGKALGGGGGGSGAHAEAAARRQRPARGRRAVAVAVARRRTGPAAASSCYTAQLPLRGPPLGCQPRSGRLPPPAAAHCAAPPLSSPAPPRAESGGVRPFGVSLLLAGYDDNGPQLYQIDPSGSYFAWKASAIGKNMNNAKTFLEKRYSDEVGIEDAIHTALLTLKEGFEGQVSGSNIEVRRRARLGQQGSRWAGAGWAERRAPIRQRGSQRQRGLMAASGGCGGGRAVQLSSRAALIPPCDLNPPPTLPGWHHRARQEVQGAHSGGGAGLPAGGGVSAQAARPRRRRLRRPRARCAPAAGAAGRRPRGLCPPTPGRFVSKCPLVPPPLSPPSERTAVVKHSHRGGAGRGKAGRAAAGAGAGAVAPPRVLDLASPPRARHFQLRPCRGCALPRRRSARQAAGIGSRGRSRAPDGPAPAPGRRRRHPDHP
jgi:20S proteasome alpha/beta subunit